MWVILYFGLGFIASLLFLWMCSKDGYLTLKDLLGCLVFTIFGPLSLITGLLMLITEHFEIPSPEDIIIWEKED